MDELEASGAFESALSDEDDIDRELEELSTQGAVDSELETLKGEVGSEAASEEGGESTESDEAVEAELEEIHADVDAEESTE
jgi:phage shock protein A